eukprot:3045276-Rhodomonas_salina.1
MKDGAEKEEKTADAAADAAEDAPPTDSQSKCATPTKDDEAEAVNKKRAVEGAVVEEPAAKVAKVAVA